MKRIRLLAFFIVVMIGGYQTQVSIVEAAQPSTDDRHVAVLIRYYAPQAGKVDFLWGINDWQRIPEELHLEGTTVQDGVMMTPMRRIGEIFEAEIHVPPGATVQYRFSIKETSDGKSIEVLDRGREPGIADTPIQPVLIATYDKVFEVDAATDPNSAIINQVFLYRHPGAGRVTMVWGINDWETVPEAANAPETRLEGDRMYTQMIRWGDNFQTSIPIQKGSFVRFGFNYLEEESGESGTNWTYDGSYSLIADEDGALELIDFQSDSEDGNISEGSIIESSAVAALLSKHWPLLIVAALLGIGLIIGFKMT